MRSFIILAGISLLGSQVLIAQKPIKDYVIKEPFTWKDKDGDYQERVFELKQNGDDF